MHISKMLGATALAGALFAGGVAAIAGASAGGASAGAASVGAGTPQSTVAVQASSTGETVASKSAKPSRKSGSSAPHTPGHPCPNMGSGAGSGSRSGSGAGTDPGSQSGSGYQSPGAGATYQ